MLGIPCARWPAIRSWRTWPGAAARACVLVLLSVLPVAAAERVMERTGEPLVLALNEARTFRLDGVPQNLFTANPQIVDLQWQPELPRLLHVFGRGLGETTLIVIDPEERVLINRLVRVEPDLQRLRDLMQGLAPQEAVTVTAVHDSVVLAGTVRTAETAENLRLAAARYIGSDARVINRLGVLSPTQVNLRVRVAEIGRDVIKQLGIDWNTLVQAGTFAVGVSTANTNLTSTILFSQLAQGNQITPSFQAGGLNLNAVIDALANQDLVTVLAEPNLTAISGQEASFLVGGEFPIPVPQGDDGITVAFREFGVLLRFTPTVLSEDRITLQVTPEVSALTSEGALQIDDITVPALTTRRASTTVELGSGQSFAIAGLLQSELADSVAKIPGLGDIPILGRLFQSETYRRSETELVIIVTPYIVRPLDPQRGPADPLAGLPLRTDLERAYAAGALAPGAGPPPAVQPIRLGGPVGYVLE